MRRLLASRPTNICQDQSRGRTGTAFLILDFHAVRADRAGFMTALIGERRLPSHCRKPDSGLLGNVQLLCEIGVESMHSHRLTSISESSSKPYMYNNTHMFSSIPWIITILVHPHCISLPTTSKPAPTALPFCLWKPKICQRTTAYSFLSLWTLQYDPSLEDL